MLVWPSSVTRGDTSIGTGLRLRAAREVKQRSLREIADTTKIALKALTAIEEHDGSQLPPAVYTRAYVRSYAAEVGLDPEQTARLHCRRRRR